MNFKWTKTQTELFINAFRKYPCLWEMKGCDYNNKVFKKQAAEAVLAEIGLQGLTLQDIFKKIMILRGQYRKAKRFINQSGVSVAGDDQAYQPKLWCFQQLQFLDCEVDLPLDLPVDLPVDLPSSTSILKIEKEEDEKIKLELVEVKKSQLIFCKYSCENSKLSL